MKGNPQNIEVGDVVSFISFPGRNTTSQVLSISDYGYLPDHSEAIDGYLVEATVVDMGFLKLPVKELTIIRKWDGSIPSEHVKQEEVKTQSTCLFEMLTDESIDPMELAVATMKKNQEQANRKG